MGITLAAVRATIARMQDVNPKFGLATIEIAGHAQSALQVAGAYWPLAATGFDSGGAIGGSVVDLLENWDESFERLSRHAQACIEGAVSRVSAVPTDQARILSPLRYPRKIIGIAFNYRSQFAELGLPAKPMEPLPFFVRPATNTLVGPSEPVCMPQGDGLDWEIEIGVVMGRRMRHVSAEEGLRGVAAYAVTVDFTVRDLLAVNTPFKTDLFRAKCQDALSPIGAVLTPAAFVPDPHALRLQLSINGRMKQDESSSGMLVPIGELISEVSRYVTWEPGDLLLSGTPAGTSGKSGQYLKPGDRVHAQIESLGELDFQILPRVADSARLNNETSRPRVISR